MTSSFILYHPLCCSNHLLLQIQPSWNLVTWNSNQELFSQFCGLAGLCWEAHLCSSVVKLGLLMWLHFGWDFYWGWNSSFTWLAPWLGASQESILLHVVSPTVYLDPYTCWLKASRKWNRKLLESWAKNQNIDASFAFCWSKQITRCTQIQTKKYRPNCGHFQFTALTLFLLLVRDQLIHPWGSSVPTLPSRWSVLLPDLGKAGTF